MKLLVQASDYGFTRASTYGVIDSIDLGLVRNTGLFVNMPTAKFAVDLLKTRTNVCLGLDFNITNGPCVSNPQKIPHLVDKEGNFIRSSVRVKDPRFQTEEGRREMFPYQECLLEMNAQYQLFLKLTGKRPGYLHDHSLSHENYTDTIRQLSKEYRVPYTRDIQEKYHFGSLGKKMYPEAFAMNKEIDYEKLKQNFDTSIFDKMFLSFELDMLKPYDDIYQYVISILDTKPQNIYFFDDNRENVEGAIRNGINAFQSTGLNIKEKVLKILKRSN